MKIELSDPQIKVVLAALEAFSRFRINQPKTALEAIFPDNTTFAFTSREKKIDGSGF